MKTLITLLILAASLSAQVTISVGDITIPTEVAVAVNTWRKAHTTVTTKLSAGINASTTTIPVLSVSGISVGSHLMIENEELTVTAVGANSVTATRGTVQTTAAIHANAVDVRVLEWSTNLTLVRQWIKSGIIGILRSEPSATIVTNKAAIVTAEAAIAAAEAGVVQ